MAGVTLGACASPSVYRFSDPDFADSIIRAMSTLIGGAVVALAYAWKPALVGIGWFPLPR